MINNYFKVKDIKKKSTFDFKDKNAYFCSKYGCFQSFNQINR